MTKKKNIVSPDRDKIGFACRQTFSFLFMFCALYRAVNVHLQICVKLVSFVLELRTSVILSFVFESESERRDTTHRSSINFRDLGRHSEYLEGERINSIGVEIGSMFEVERKAVMDEGSLCV